MTPTQAKELLPVLAAYSEGRVVQFRNRKVTNPDWHVWRDFQADSDMARCRVVEFLDPTHEWRVAPTPRDWWLCPSCLHGFVYSEKEHRNTFKCAKCLVNVVRVREVVA